MNAKIVFIAFLLTLVYSKEILRVKRRIPLEKLPAGVEEYLGPLRDSNFECPPQPRFGYYADETNDCRIFHVCQISEMPGNDQLRVEHNVFACGNHTVFNQQSLTCIHPPPDFDCGDSPNFYFKNERFGTNEDFDQEGDAKRSPKIRAGK